MGTVTVTTAGMRLGVSMRMPAGVLVSCGMKIQQSKHSLPGPYMQITRLTGWWTGIIMSTLGDLGSGMIEPNGELRLRHRHVNARPDLLEVARPGKRVGGLVPRPPHLTPEAAKKRSWLLEVRDVKTLD